MTRFDYFQQIINGIGTVTIVPGAIANEPQRTPTGDVFVRGKVNFQQLLYVGLTAAGLQAVRTLAELLRQNHPDLKRTATLDGLETMMVDLVLREFSDLARDSVTSQHLDVLEHGVLQWKSDLQQGRRHLVSCLVVPRDCGAFSVGPVTFFHVSELDQRRKAWDSRHAQDIGVAAYEQFLKDMAQSGAHYLADVQVCGREPKHSKTVADVTVDLALAGLQLFLPLEDSRHFSRTSARRWSAQRNDVVICGGSVTSGGENRSPGLMLFPQPFRSALQQAQVLLDSVGHRLESFLSGAPALPKLNQAWCDAAYWMHEGFAESLDTIAVAKLETAIEVLLSASSSKLSTARMRSALRVFNGLSPEQPLFRGSSQTVNDFVKEVVETRSRVLHGTLSTLTEEATQLSAAISILARDHILKYTLALDRYAKEVHGEDDIGGFLGWLEDKRAWEWEWGK